MVSSQSLYRDEFQQSRFINTVIPSHAMDELLPDENAVSESSSLPFSVMNPNDFHLEFGISTAELMSSHRDNIYFRPRE